MKMKGSIKSALKAYITGTAPGIYYHYFTAQHLSDTSQTQGMGCGKGLFALFMETHINAFQRLTLREFTLWSGGDIPDHTYPHAS